MWSLVVTHLFWWLVGFGIGYGICKHFDFRERRLRRKLREIESGAEMHWTGLVRQYYERYAKDKVDEVQDRSVH